MRILHFQVNSYKSFFSTSKIDLTPGFNVVVGQNNVGKTALVEALSLQFGNKQHRSLRTARTPQTTTLANSQITVWFEVSSDELTELLISLGGPFYVPVVPNPNPAFQTQRFREALSERNIIEATFEAGNVISASLVGYSDQDLTAMRLYEIDTSDGSLVQVNPPRDTALDRRNNFAASAASILRERIYRFSAERLNVTEGPIAANPILASNASNLPPVLNLLQTTNPSRFQQFNQLGRVCKWSVRERS